jgi:hypothetical protein
MDIETICANSHRNFHAKGLDYLCLSRTPELTRKVYFFEGDLQHLPEVVIPHNHRYAFTTTVLSGAVRNRIFHRYSSLRISMGLDVLRYDRFSYLTPLNGGAGFSWEAEELLTEEPRSKSFTRGQFYESHAEDIHTLDIRCEDTVVMIEQWADEVPLDEPTLAWRLVGSRTPPALDGLYDRMTPDHALKRIDQFLSLVGQGRRPA